MVCRRLVTTFLILPAVGASGDVLRVVSITLLALPAYAARAVPLAMLDRKMSFGRVAAVEAADTIGFNLFALLAALAGLGVFSLAGAVPVGAMLGAGVAWMTPRTSPAGPAFDLSRVKPLISFGSRVSVLGMLYLGRDLGYVTIIGAVGGAPMAGFYGMASASSPSRLPFPRQSPGSCCLPSASPVTKDRSARPFMLGQVALVCGLPLALIAGAIQPFIDVVLGPEWLPTSTSCSTACSR